MLSFFPSAVNFPFVLCFIFSWFVMLVVGNGLIAWLKNLKGMKWSPREDTPESHGKKAGVPSMGGIGIIGSALAGLLATIGVMTLLFEVRGWLLMGTQLTFFLFPLLVAAHTWLGFADDWSKASGKGGLLARQKLFGQVGFAVLFLILLFFFERQSRGSSPAPFSAAPWWVLTPTVLLALLVIIGTSNAVNLTDGIDGLAAGLSVQVALAFAVLLIGNFFTKNDPYFNSAGFFWICLGGACLGFLAFNKNPARVFMGDTSSLALGAALGAGAILTRSVFLLPFIGFMFYIEMFSVMAQVAYFKYTKKKTGEGKRIFRRAPLHHHFELSGWSEWRVVGTFWAINAVTTVVGLILWKARILPRFP